MKAKEVVNAILAMEKFGSWEERMEAAIFLDRAYRTYHKRCGTPVTFDPQFISVGDPEMLSPGEDSGYYAACLTCDEDVYKFETEERV